MNEKDFWSHLEFRVCRELSGLEKASELGLWCDGFLPDHSVITEPAPYICGKVWIMGCSKIKEEWNFALYLIRTINSETNMTDSLPDSINYEKIDWSVLLPPDDQTGWLKVNLEEYKLTIIPAAAYVSEEDVLNRLGYTRQWLDYGILTMDDVLKQYTDLFISDDPDEEHYRYRAFHHYMENKTSLTDQEIENIYQLTDNGPDNNDLHESRLSYLLFNNFCTDKQLNRLGQLKEFQGPPLQKRFNRELLIRKIQKKGLTEDVLADIKSTEDSFIHEYILSRSDLNREHLLWLEEHGLNKKIRNRTKQMLNSRKYRE